VGGARGTYERQKKLNTEFWCENLKDSTPGISQRRWENIIKMYCTGTRFKGKNCIRLARDTPMAGFWETR
jgi:hypothetical protein